MINFKYKPDGDVLKQFMKDNYTNRDKWVDDLLNIYNI